MEKTEFVAPSFGNVKRVMIMGASMQGWFDATEDERKQLVLPMMKDMFKEWEEMGAVLVSTFDDDLLNVGPPATAQFTWYLLYEMDSIDMVPALLHRARVSREGYRLDRYLRLEARAGRKFFLLEQ